MGDIIVLKARKVTSAKVKSELKQYGIPGGGANIIATIKDLKDAVMVVPYLESTENKGIIENDQ